MELNQFYSIAPEIGNIKIGNVLEEIN